MKNEHDAKILKSVFYSFFAVFSIIGIMYLLGDIGLINSFGGSDEQVKMEWVRYLECDLSNGCLKLDDVCYKNECHDFDQLCKEIAEEDWQLKNASCVYIKYQTMPQDCTCSERVITKEPSCVEKDSSYLCSKLEWENKNHVVFDINFQSEKVKNYLKNNQR